MQGNAIGYAVVCQPCLRHSVPIFLVVVVVEVSGNIPAQLIEFSRI
jgi:hypothetical protein